MHFFDAEICRVRADLLAAANEAAAAEREFTRAISIARGQGVRHWELRAATSLARLWRDQGRFAEAVDLLAPVYDSFEGHAAPDLIRAGALLGELRQTWRSKQPTARLLASATAQETVREPKLDFAGLGRLASHKNQPVQELGGDFGAIPVIP
jgi:hypothetical protein